MTRYLSKRDLINEIHGILAMCEAFDEIGLIGGQRKKDMIEYLPHQIACRLMELQDLIASCELEDKPVKVTWSVEPSE